LKKSKHCCMKITFTHCLVFAMLSAAAQVDTVVVRPDSTFESLFHRKLYDALIH